jgi:dTDP-glucose pyrophosphorylase
MNILIPMAGSGLRFSNVGYELPKPLIKINHRTILERAIDTLNIEGNYIFIVRKYDNQDHNKKVENILRRNKPSCEILMIDYVTEGPACSALLAKEYIDNDQELIIANCDQIMWWSGSRFINYARSNNFDGAIVTYTTNTPKNSYAKIDLEGNVVQVAEKKVISNIGLNGIHYWKEGKYFVNSAQRMMKNNDRVNNEYYIAPTYNYMIESGKKVGIYHIPNEQHNAVGVPADLEIFLERAKEYEYF